MGKTKKSNSNSGSPTYRELWEQLAYEKQVRPFQDELNQPFLIQPKDNEGGNSPNSGERKR